MHSVEAADSSTPLRSAQNDSALMTSNLEVTHDVINIAVIAAWPRIESLRIMLGPRLSLNLI